MDSVLSLHHVDTEPFRKFVGRMTGGRLFPRCRQTVTTQLEDKFLERKQKLKEKLATLKSVCTTADCWTSRRRSFIGVTVHWLEASQRNVLERRGCCLAIRELSGRHTYDVIAKALEGIHNEFNITEKISCTVTDSGANFLKAFRHFSMDEAGESGLPVPPHNDDNTGDNADIDMVFHEIDEILEPTTELDEAVAEDHEELEHVTYKLPPHRKCACHLLNLVATTDLSKLQGAVKRTSVQAFGKLTGMWNKQNRSAPAAEKIKSALGTYLITPGDTRWNSMYDSVVKVQSILSVPEQQAKFDTLCDELIGTRLLPQQKTFIDEYVQVMAPIACGLDVLQGEEAVTLGFLSPTISIIKLKLQGLLHPPKLTVCQPIVQLLLSAIDKRFGNVLVDNTSANLAAVVHPKFKLDWIDRAGHKAELIDLLKRSVNRLEGLQDIEQPSSQDPQADSDTAVDFFAELKNRRQNYQNVVNVGDQEVDCYLSDLSCDLSSLDKYPNIRELYIKLNTGLPSSAAVERLFSLGGRVFSPLRARLSSAHFEMMVFLRSAKFDID